ncbi:oxidoreductase [Microlunatus ginsengisoli]|uniref:Fido domain-containing protein n=1 Tax=Microlunatus ginsengisoli TaxID=363863 RepID=A0ABP7APW8_9ACTN
MSTDPLVDLARLEGVPSELAAARDSVDVLLRDRGLRVVSAEQSAQALLAAARASAALTGDPDRWLPGAVRLARELPALSALVLVSPGQALARAHALAAHGEVGDDALGRLRDDGEAGRRTAALAELLCRPTEAPALLLAAIAHAELAVVAPFGSADGLVARAVEHMVLIATGVDPLGVVVVESGHAADPAGYVHALDGYASGTVSGVRAWLVHCARAVTYGVSASPLVR